MNHEEKQKMKDIFMGIIIGITISYTGFLDYIAGIFTVIAFSRLRFVREYMKESLDEFNHKLRNKFKSG